MMSCPQCGTESDGSYCPECGTPLRDASCRECEAVLPTGARFCTRCGERVRDRAPIGPWLVAGIAVVALVVALAAPRVAGPDEGAAGPMAGPAAGPMAGPAAGAATGQATGPAPAANAGQAPGTDGATPPPLTGSPREQADRLFNRVMSASGAGDTAEVSFFLPMAIEAYRRIDGLDTDGRFHLSVLYAAAGDGANARAAAERMLDADPDHLLALGAAARAAVIQGDEEAARRFYDRLLEVYETETASDRPEYREHARMLPEYREEARGYLGN